MGCAMAANLLKAGLEVRGYDVVAGKRAALKRAGGKPAASIGKLKASVIITSLPSAAALHAVAEELDGKSVVIETSTLPIEDKEKARATLKRNGITLLDCPLSGTGAQAKTKDLVVFASGERTAFDLAKSVFPAFSRAHYYLGAFGNGSRMKFVANLLVAIHNVSAAEAFVLGMKSGLPAKTIFEVIENSAGSSRMFQVRGPQMVKARVGAPTSLFNASAAIYNAAVAQGHGKDDTAAVCAVLESMANLRR
jgi:3-hydroxyisobutyrate dehydrogenase-like beta-hydroxyacid dehydrogenase